MNRYRIAVEFEAKDDDEARRFAKGVTVTDAYTIFGRPITVVRDDLTKHSEYWYPLPTEPNS